MGFGIFATSGTANVLDSGGIESRVLLKVSQGRSDILELIKKGDISLIINTPSGLKGRSDMKQIRQLAVVNDVPCITTIQGARAAVNGIESIINESFVVKPIQEYTK
jgi:carbamoyl-phosphate synthase large subunit